MPDTAYVERDGTIATIILDRPQRLNALDVDMAALLVGHLQGLTHDDGVSSIIITGSGRAFCAGGDLGWAAAYRGGPASGFHVLASHLHQALLEIHRTGQPVIAAVNGVAAGAGFSLLRRSTETPLEVQLEHERAGIVVCARTAEGAEGISAFIGKRAPDFPATRTRDPGR